MELKKTAEEIAKDAWELGKTSHKEKLKQEKRARRRAKHQKKHQQHKAEKKETRMERWEAKHGVGEGKMAVVLGMTKKEAEAREEKRKVEEVRENMEGMTVEGEEKKGEN